MLKHLTTSDFLIVSALDLNATISILTGSKGEHVSSKKLAHESLTQSSNTPVSF